MKGFLYGLAAIVLLFAVVILGPKIYGYPGHMMRIHLGRVLLSRLRDGQEHAAMVTLMASPPPDCRVADQSGSTALMYACDHGLTDMASVILDSGANVNQTDAQGRTALVRAVLRAVVSTSGQNRREMLRMIRVLLDHGADPRIRDQSGQSVLAIAARHERTDLITGQSRGRDP